MPHVARDTPITQRPRGQSSYASNRHDRPILHRSRSDNGLLRARERTCGASHFAQIKREISETLNVHFKISDSRDARREEKFLKAVHGCKPSIGDQIED